MKPALNDVLAQQRESWSNLINEAVNPPPPPVVTITPKWAIVIADLLNRGADACEEICQFHLSDWMFNGWSDSEKTALLTSIQLVDGLGLKQIEQITTPALMRYFAFAIREAVSHS